MNWKEMSNSEIEVRLKELEFEYDKVKSDINKLYEKINIINSEYIKGKFIINKRINPTN
jgi:hypothetical protein